MCSCRILLPPAPAVPPPPAGILALQSDIMHGHGKAGEIHLHWCSSGQGCGVPRPPTGAEVYPGSFPCAADRIQNVLNLETGCAEFDGLFFLFILISSLRSYFILQVGELCMSLVSIDNLFTKLFWLLRY